jgi:putative endonuclease
MSHFKVYVLSAINFKRSYVGCTSDIEKRLQYHNSGKVISTKKYKPWKLVYSEDFESKSEALAMEKYFKTAAGRRKLKVIFATFKE